MGYKERQLEESKNRQVDHYVSDEGLPGIRMRDRKCTDPVVCVLFIVWIILMIVISGWAFKEGDVKKLAWKFDMDLKDCPDNHQKKLFTRIVPEITSQEIIDFNAKTGVKIPGNMHYAVCAEKCPKKGDKVNYTPTEFYVKDSKNSKELDNWQKYDTQDLMGFCFPDETYMKEKGKDVYKILTDKMGNMSRYVEDVGISWKIILVVGILSFFITLIYLYLLRWITKPILYISLFLVFIFGALITFWCFNRAQEYPEGSDDRSYSYAAMAVAGIITLIYTIFICCQWTNIKIGAEIMGLAGEFVSTQPRIMIVPIVAYLCMVPIVVWFIFTNVYLYSMGEKKIEKGDMFATLEESKATYWMFWVFLFGFFWIIAFFIAVMQFVIASVCALWYFTHAQGSDSPAQATAVNRSMKWALRTHSGSLAFGAMLIAIVTMLKFIFEFFAKQQEKLSQSNPVAKAAIWCMRCCIWCLDACVKFVSENAYVQIAVGGFTFCEGAKNAFFMLTRNPGTFLATRIAGWLMTAIGKATIMGFSTYIAMVMAEANAMTDGAVIQQPFVPAFFVLLISWVVAAFFISLFDFSCLTILQCFLISRELKCTALHVPDALLELIDDEEERQLVKHTRTSGGGSKSNQVAAAK